MNNNNLNKRFGLGKGGGDNPYVLNKFKPGKREHVLDDSLLDDATRRMLMEEIQRVPPPRMQPPSSSASVGTSTSAQSEKVKDVQDGGGTAGMRANAAGPKAPPAHLDTNHHTNQQQYRGAASHTSSFMSSGAGAGDLDLLTMMTSRLKTLESSQRVLQLELKEKSKRVIELEDKLKASEEARKKDSDAKRGLQKELGEMLLFLTDHGLTWDGGYEGSYDDADTSRHASSARKEAAGDGKDKKGSSLLGLNPNPYEPLGREGREGGGISGAGHGKTVSTETSDIDSHVVRKAKPPALSLLYDGDFVMPDASSDSTHQHARVGLTNSAQNNSSNPPEARIGTEATSSAPPSARRVAPRLLSKIPVGVGVPITPALEKELTPNKSGRRRSSTAAASSSAQVDGADELPFDLELLKRNCLILSDHVGSQAFLGEGQQRVLMEREKVFLCIYSDGICVNSGPFRPYGWALCDAFLNDILEGYYPYEFKDRYPDGFPVEVIDRSTEKCPGNGKGQAPKAGTADTDKKAGMGRKLGGTGNNAQPIVSNHLLISPSSPAPSSLSPSSPTPQQGRAVATLGDKKKEEGTFKPMTREEFLKKLPERYVGPGGKLINIRAGVEDLGAYKNQDGGDVGRGMGAGRILGHGLQRPTQQPSRGVYIPIRTNVERLLQQAAENKRIDNEILISLRVKEKTQHEADAEAGQEGQRSRAPPLPSRLLMAKTSRGEAEGMSTCRGVSMAILPNDSRALVISAQGEIVGIGGTAPTNDNFLRTIRGQTPADAELARRHQGQSGASPTTPIAAAVVGDGVVVRPRIVTLQVRMPQGQRCVLNMFETDTIADVRSEFERAVPDFFRGCDSRKAQYELTCAFPRRVCSDHSSKLEVLGLFPNATLMVRMHGTDLYL